MSRIQIEAGILKTDIRANILAVFMREHKCLFLQSLDGKNASDMQLSEFLVGEYLVQV